MQTSLAVTALLMGLAGGPHCIAMCGAACAGIGQAAGERRVAALWTFQAGRVLGYSVLGALAGTSMHGATWLSLHFASLRPFWTLFHVAVFVFGLLLLLQARQPIWLEQAGRAVWLRARQWVNRPGIVALPLILGGAWALMPCGLLYAALLAAGLTGDALSGAGFMALFALGTSAAMLAGPWAWLRLGGNALGGWGVRLAGLTLAVSSGWVLWMAMAHH